MSALNRFRIIVVATDVVRCAPAAFVLFGCSSSSTPVVALDASVEDAAADVMDAGPATPQVDKSKLLPGECSEEINCAEGVCTDFRRVSNGDPDLQRPRCSPQPECSLVTCPAGQACGVQESTPGQISCQPLESLPGGGG